MKKAKLSSASTTPPIASHRQGRTVLTQRLKKRNPCMSKAFGSSCIGLADNSRSKKILATNRGVQKLAHISVKAHAMKRIHFVPWSVVCRTLVMLHAPFLSLTFLLRLCHRMLRCALGVTMLGIGRGCPRWRGRRLQASRGQRHEHLSNRCNGKALP